MGTSRKGISSLESGDVMSSSSKEIASSRLEIKYVPRGRESVPSREKVKISASRKGIKSLEGRDE